MIIDTTSNALISLHDLFESLDATEFKFGHPFFGGISAQEWLALKGGHEMRHIRQIEKLLAKINEEGPSHEEGSMTGAFNPG